MALANMLLELLGQQHPRDAAMARATQGTPQPAAPTPGAEGMGPGMAAPPPPPQPAVYQSPPEIMQLYADLMKRSQQERSINSGLGLITASLAQPENRAGIMASFNGGGGDDPASFVSSLMEMQMGQQKLQQQAASRQALPSIASKYGLDLATAQYLFDTGKLDSVIAELEKPDKQIVTQEDGTFVIVDKSTGELSDPMGPSKQREIQIITDDRGNQFPVYKDTGERVGGTGNMIVRGRGATNDERLWRADEADRVARGLPSRTLSEFLTAQKSSPTGGGQNVTPDGRILPDPEKGMVYDTNEDGSVKLDPESGAPIQIPVVGGSVWRDEEAGRMQQEGQARQSDRTSMIVNQEVDNALKIIDELKDNWIPGTGLGSLYGQLPLGGPHRDLNQAVETIRSNIGFDKLQEMRAASPTGGALGQVSDFENRLLQATMGSLDLSQSHEQVTRNLRRIQSFYSKLDQVLSAPDMATAEKAARELDTMLPDMNQREGDPGEESLDDLLKKYGGQ